MSLTTQRPSYNARHLNTNTRKQLALRSIAQSQTITEIAKAHRVSRKFVYQQQNSKRSINSTY